ncbi:MAG: hypothetical protein MUE90_10440 [Thermoanaerobaculales bacterium]|nr:hypothetical protein [Thermoanaerobaculales bacterium]
MLVEMNETLAAMGMDVRVAYAEYITSGEGGEAGQIIYANNRGNKQLSGDWVPGDPRRYGVNEIYWTTDQIDMTSDVAAGAVNAAIDRAMDSWQEVICSTIPLVEIPDYGYDFGYVQYLLGFGGLQGWLADLTHAGWLPAGFFDSIAPGGSGYILGVTFTFVFTGTDIDGNGKSDVAFREIYYNDTFDIETVVLHETGHGLSQAHFGKIYRDAGAGGLHFSPLAVMNAAYSGLQQELTGTDVGGHCSNWGSWPNE